MWEYDRWSGSLSAVVADTTVHPNAVFWRARCVLALFTQVYLIVTPSPPVLGDFYMWLARIPRGEQNLLSIGCWRVER